jgi:two-component system cell cycle response regulator
MEKHKVLIVDDDNFIRKVLKDALESRYLIFEASCGESAIMVANETRLDLIILDIEMPGINGIEVCKQLKGVEQTKRIPVVLISAHTNREEIILGLQSGADDYLTKPIYPPEVLARVDAHLRYKSYYNDLDRCDLQILLELYDSITVLRNPMKILQMVVEKICEVIPVERCSIVSINNHEEVVVKACNHFEGNEEIRLDLSRYPEIRKAIETREAVVINDIKNDLLMESVRQHLSQLGFNSMIVVPIIKKECVIGTLLLGTASTLKDGISDRIFKLCHLVANISANALENATLFESMKSAKDLLEEMAIRDGLTRLFTHRHFYDRLEREFSRSVRHCEPLSLIFLDIDSFKRINDKYGHMRGDEVIRQIGRMIREIVRDSDIPARYGGEEFVLLLPNTGTEGACELARRLSSLISEFRYEGLKNEQITVSSGISTLANKNLQTFDQLVQIANQMMFKAKAEGKNRIAHLTP